MFMAAQKRGDTMFKTKLMTAAAVMTLTAAGFTGLAYAQTSTNSLGTADQSAPASGAAGQTDTSTATTGSTSASTSVSDTGSADQTNTPVRSKTENNRMSRKDANKITAELNQQQLQGLPSSSLAASGDTGLRTTDNSSVAAGSVASPSPSTATGDTVAPTDDSTLPPSQTETPNLPNSTVDSLPEEGKPGTNSNPTDAADKPEVQ
jgi:hypothetical protein